MLDMFILDFIVSSFLGCNLGSHRYGNGSVKTYDCTQISGLPESDCAQRNK